MKSGMPKGPVLLVALDFIDAHRALQLAKEAVEGGADWLEAGTPLIKSEGMDIIRRLKREFPGIIIAADMKIIDTGALEVEIAARAGADVVILLGVADDGTIREAVETGHRFGVKLMADLIGVRDMVERAQKLGNLGVDYICVHVGIDQQMQGMEPLPLLKEIAEVVHIPLAIAGGINSETAALAVQAGAYIVIVGGAVSKAEKAEQAVRRIKTAMMTKVPKPTKLYKKYRLEEAADVLRQVSTPNVSDAMQKKGEMYDMHPITQGVKAVGKAVTVRTAPGDWAKPIEAIDIATPENIIVIDAGGLGGKAVWGELATWSCLQRGVQGVVIDGSIRDVDSIRKLKFPAFARSINPTAGDAKGFGEINVEITCAGVQIHPNDWVVADDTGVIVIPKDQALEIANRAMDVAERENRVREEIKRGSTLSAVLRLKKWEKMVK